MIVCWGELLWDIFADGPRLGGAAANVAYHVSQLGQPAALVSRVGNDELGRRAIAELERGGVATELVQVDESFPTGTVHVQVRDGEPSFSIGERAAWDRIQCDEAVASAMAEAKVIVFGTLAQRTPLAQGALARALSVLSPRALRICDLNIRRPQASRDAVDTSLASADVLKLNETELRTLGELFGTSDPLRWLIADRGVGLVALTRGAHGCLLATSDDRAEHAGFQVSADSGDAVGAGDAFVAVLACVLARDRSAELDEPALARLAERANRYAAFVASRRGGMPAVPAALRSTILADLGP